MGDPRYIWNPLSLPEVARYFANCPALSWVAGGWAIDLHIGRQGREHEDTDILLCRQDQLAVFDVFPDWEIHAAGRPTETKLELWQHGVEFPSDVHDIWCRPSPEAPWALQFMLVDTEGDDWLFRRDHRIRGPLATMGLVNPDGLPYLAPEIQLLYKSKGRRPKDQVDLQNVLPHLEPHRRAWLIEALRLHDPENAWLQDLNY